MSKAVRLAAKLDAEGFWSFSTASLTRTSPRPSRLVGVEADIREIVDQRHRQLEYTAERRELGCGVACVGTPTHEGIVRQVLRHEPDLLIVQ